MKKIVFLIAIIFIQSIAKSQSCHNVKELLRKRHTIKEMTYGHPYTTFDRHNNFNFETTIENIRKRINDDKPLGPVYLAYQSIYTNAKLPAQSLASR